jgi:hypothetical protein
LSVDHSFDAVPKMQDVEVNEQSDAEATQPHVGKKLSMVDWMNGVDGLHFHNDSPLHCQVDSVSDFELLAFIDHWLRNLGGHF